MAKTDSAPATPSGSGRVLHPLIELTRTRLLEFVREPEAVFWVFVFPVLLAVALGIAFRAKAPDKPRVGVLGGQSSQAGVLAAALGKTEQLVVIELTEAQASAALATGKIDILVAINPSLSDARGQGEVTLRFDPSRPEGSLARLAVESALVHALHPEASPVIKDETVVAKGSRYIDFVIPGLVGMNIMGSGMWGLGFAIVWARTRKLLKRFAATPMRRSHYLLSFMFSRLFMLGPEVIALVVFGWLFFGVAVRGSMLALGVVSLAGAFAFAGLGLLVAARPTTIEGVSGWMNFVQMPMWLLSGTFFSYERFPQAFHPAIKALPLTALNDALRAVITHAAPLTGIALELAILLAWGTISFALAVRFFRWQ